MKKYIFALSTFFLASISYANSFTQGSPYAGVQLGFGQINTPSSATNFTSSNTNGGFAYRILGGYDMMVNDHLHFAPEIGYTNYPDNSYNSFLFQSNYHSSYWDLLVNTKYYIINGWQVTGKLGMAYVTQVTTLTLPGDSDTVTINKLLPEVGAAMGYDFTNMLGIDVSYNYILGQSISSDDVLTDPNRVAPVTTIMLGVNYTF